MNGTATHLRVHLSSSPRDRAVSVRVRALRARAEGGRVLCPCHARPQARHARGMSATSGLFALLCAWLVIGILSCFVMTRRGHDPWSWGVLGALLGPLVIPLALAAIRRERETSTVVASVHAGQVGRGPISVLVGVDGSVEAAAAVTHRGGTVRTTPGTPGTRHGDRFRRGRVGACRRATAECGGPRGARGPRRVRRGF